LLHENEKLSSAETAKLVQLCAQASKDAYKAPEHKGDPMGGDVASFPAKIDGTFKATLMVEHKDENGTKTIIVSIRGSKKVVDWITNFNCDPVVDTDSFLVRLVHFLLLRKS